MTPRNSSCFDLSLLLKPVSWQSSTGVTSRRSDRRVMQRPKDLIFADILYVKVTIVNVVITTITTITTIITITIQMCLNVILSRLKTGRIPCRKIVPTVLTLRLSRLSCLYALGLHGKLRRGALRSLPEISQFVLAL